MRKLLPLLLIFSCLHSGDQFFSRFLEEVVEAVREAWQPKDPNAGLIPSLIDEARLLPWGVYPQEFEKGKIQGSVSSPQEVRITAINGILNSTQNARDFFKAVSMLNGGVDVYYVYWHSQGWTKDLFRGAFAKFGIVSRSAVELAATWRILLEEMGEDGIIFHYAHSAGGLETFRAGDLLRPEEKARIHVYTFGSPVLIPETGFGSVRNFVGKRDAVSMLDPVAYSYALRGEMPHIVFVGDHSGVFPLFEHHMFSDTYLGLVKELGASFQAAYLSSY